MWSTGEWRAKVLEDGQSLMMDAKRVLLARRLPDGYEQIVGFDDGGRPVVERLLEGSLPRAGFLLSNETLAALADALKPGPAEGELRRLEEALAVERTRVDRCLDRRGP